MPNNKKQLSRKEIVARIENSLRDMGTTDKMKLSEWNEILRWWKTAPIADVRGEAETCFGWTVSN